MKTAKFSDGTIYTRETHTRDYKYAYKAVSPQGNVEVGFSTSKNSAESAARAFVNLTLKTKKEWHKAHGTLTDFEYSDEGKTLKSTTIECLSSIETVEVY
jgi:hypothetical protein